MAETKDPDIDKGFAWAILAGCFFMYMFVVGTVKSYGVLYTEMLEYYSAGSGNTAWLGSFCLLFMMGLGPIANLLSKKFTFRIVSFIGGVFLSVGYITSAFVPSFGFLYLTFTLVGLGYGLSFSPCSTIISFYFEKHRALANGLTVSASGIGALALPFLYRYLVSTFSLPGTFLIVGGLLLHVCAAACIFRQPRLLIEMQKKIKQEKHAKYRKSDQNGLLNGDTVDSEQHEKEKKKCNCDLDLFKFSLFKNPRFLLYIISFVVCMNGYGNNLILIPSHVAALGYDKSKIALTVSIMGGSEILSRILFGWFADKNIVKRRTIFIFNMAFASIFAFLAPLDVFQNFTYMAVYAALIGIFPGSFWSLISVLIIDVVGMKDFSSAFGLLSFSLAIGAAFSQPSIGWLKDYYGNWNMSFVVTGILLLTSACIMALEPLVMRLCLRSKPPVDIDQLTIDAMPLRIRNKQSPVKNASIHDTSSLLDEENDVSFTSARISRIYRPIKQESPPKSPDRTSAPIVDPREM